MRIIKITKRIMAYLLFAVILINMMNPCTAYAKEKEEKVIQVASGRIDAVIAKVYNLSRQDAIALFPAGLVYLNGMECTENAKAHKVGDVIAVRGRGKFEYDRESGLSKKGKLNCVVLIYK